MQIRGFNRLRKGYPCSQRPAAGRTFSANHGEGERPNDESTSHGYQPGHAFNSVSSTACTACYWANRSSMAASCVPMPAWVA